MGEVLTAVGKHCDQGGVIQGHNVGDPKLPYGQLSWHDR
jgi:hypothetical protein